MRKEEFRLVHPSFADLVSSLPARVDHSPVPLKRLQNDEERHQVRETFGAIEIIAKYVNKEISRKLQALKRKSERCLPEVVGPLLLTEATAGNEADPCFLQQLHAVEHIWLLAGVLPQKRSSSVIQVKSECLSITGLHAFAALPFRDVFICISFFVQDKIKEKHLKSSSS